MFLPLKLMGPTLAAAAIAQAFQSSSETIDRKVPKSEIARSQRFNPRTTGSNVTVIDSTTSSNPSNISIDPLQHVQFNLSTAAFVQNCDNGTGNPVILDCSCSVQQLAAQAIDDAFTMVQTVIGSWSEETYLPILDQYMGAQYRPDFPTVSTWINATLSHLTQIQEYQWLTYDSRWLSDNSGAASELSVYCMPGVPPPQPNYFMASCPSTSSQDSPFGWAYTLNDAKDYSYFLGFCESILAQQNFVSRAAMVEKLGAGQVTLSDDQTGANYGRAALNLLVQLVPLINREGPAPLVQQFTGYADVTYIADVYGCDTLIDEYTSLVNADSWALWISTLYFNIAATTLTSNPTSGLLPVVSANCKGHDNSCKSFVNSGECKEAAALYDDNTQYSQYTSHWISWNDYEGCTAIFQCPKGYPANGISGAHMKDYFAKIYAPTAEDGAGCGICGSVYLSNGCEFTYNECGATACETCNGTDCHHP